MWVRVSFPGVASYNVAMTLLDAPKYNARKALIRRNIIIGILIAIPFVAFFTWYWWNWPEEHRVNQFFHSIEAKDYSHAYALWNSDPDWQQHPRPLQVIYVQPIQIKTGVRPGIMASSPKPKS